MNDIDKKSMSTYSELSDAKSKLIQLFMQVVLAGNPNSHTSWKFNASI